MDIATKFIMTSNVLWEYNDKMPGDVDRIEVVQSGNPEHPEIIDIYWKSGGKSGIGNPEAVSELKPLIGDIDAFCAAAKKRVQEDVDKMRPEAQAQAEKDRPWTYVVGVLGSDGRRDEYYSWYEDNSWDAYAMTDQQLLESAKDQCRRFRAESTSRWHVYKRMRGDDKLVEVF